MNEELKVIISAEISDLEDNVSQAADTVEEFASETESASNQSDNAFKGISASAAAQFAVIQTAVNDAIGTIKSFVSEAMNQGDSIDKNAQKMQMSNKAYQEWSYACQRSGTDISSLNRGVKTITSDLGDMAKGVEVDTSAYDALGVSLRNSDGSLRKNEDVLNDVIFSLADMDDTTQRNALAQDIFGKSFSELLPLLNSGSDGLEELIGYADEYAVISDEEIQNSAALADAQLTMNEAMEKVGSAVASLLMPALSDLAYILADVFNWLSEHQTIAAILAGVIGALAAAFLVYQGVMLAVKLATTVATVAQTAFNAVMAANPIAIVIIVITALIAIIVVLAKHWDEIKAKVIEVWNSMKEKITETVENIKQKIEDFKQNIHDKFEEIKTNISEKIEAAKQAVTDKFEQIKTNIKQKVEEAKQAVIDKFQQIKDGIKDKIEEAKSAVREKFEAIKSAIQEKVSAAKENVLTAFTNIKTGITDRIEGARQAVIDKFTAIKTGIKEKIDAARDAVHDAIEKIKGFFNFSWSLPKLKMPHISVSGKFSLNPPSAPSFGISWYAKGGVFDNPALFSFGNRLGGLGENGAEAIVPLENNTEWLTKIADMLNDRQGGKQIVLTVDGKTFAQTAITSINSLTNQTGNLGLVIR